MEPSHVATKVIRDKFTDESRIEILQETVGVNSIADESLDLAVSLGVLHHIPDTERALKDIAKKVKSGGTFLCYLYYKLDHKPLLYRTLFRISDAFRLVVSRMPYCARKMIAKLIALTVYFPLARVSKYLGAKGINTSNIYCHYASYIIDSK